MIKKKRRSKSGWLVRKVRKWKNRQKNQENSIIKKAQVQKRVAREKRERANSVDDEVASVVSQASDNDKEVIVIIFIIIIIIIIIIILQI